MKTDWCVKMGQGAGGRESSLKILITTELIGRCGGLMVSALDYGLGGLGSNSGQGHCIVFFGKTLYSHSASLHPGVKISTGELLGQPDRMLGSNN